MVGGEVREELGSAFGGLGGALRFRPQLLLRRSPRVAPWASNERFSDGEGGLSHALAPGRTVLREGGPLDEGERKIETFEVDLLPSELPGRASLRAENDGDAVAPSLAAPVRLSMVMIRYPSGVSSISTPSLVTRHVS